MLDLIRKLYPLDLAPVSPDMDTFREMVNADLKDVCKDWYHSFPSGMKNANGWVVPNSWKPVAGYITDKENDVLYEFPLAGYSLPFQGECSGLDLRKHLFYHRSDRDAIPYHCDWYYKPHLRDLGICVTKDFYDCVRDLGSYEVDARTLEAPGEMEVLEYILPATQPLDPIKVYYLQAHNCHTHQADDDLSGVVVGVEVMKRLSLLPQRKNEYRLLICPEHLGTVFYLGTRGLPPNTAGTIFLEALGGCRSLRFQESFWGHSFLDYAASTAIRPLAEQQANPAVPKWYFPFRTLVGNDETVWEAPGHEVPCITVTRFPFPSYHMLNKDTPESLSERSLGESVEAVLSIVNQLEHQGEIQNNHRGLVCLSNPAFDLYVHRGTDPSIQEDGSEGWYMLMTRLPRYVAAGWTIEMVAREHNLKVEDVQGYLNRWIKKELVKWVR